MFHSDSRIAYKLKSSNLLATSSPHINGKSITNWQPLNVFDETYYIDRAANVFLAQGDIISPWLKVDMEHNFEVVRVGYFLPRRGSNFAPLYHGSW